MDPTVRFMEEIEDYLDSIAWHDAGAAWRAFAKSYKLILAKAQKAEGLKLQRKTWMKLALEITTIFTGSPLALVASFLTRDEHHLISFAAKLYLTGRSEYESRKRTNFGGLRNQITYSQILLEGRKGGTHPVSQIKRRVWQSKAMRAIMADWDKAMHTPSRYIN